MGGYMSAHQVESWMHSMGDFGYLLGFYFPLLNHLFQSFHYLYLFCQCGYLWFVPRDYHFLVRNIFRELCSLLIVRAFANTAVMDKVKVEKDVRKFLNFVNKQGVTPIFIMLCFPFTPSALMNVVAGLSKMKVRTFF